MGAPARVPLQSQCQKEIDAFRRYPFRSDYPVTDEGEAVYEGALRGYEKVSDDIRKCAIKNGGCKYTQGIFDSVLAQYSNVIVKFEKLSKDEAVKRMKITPESLGKLQKLFKRAFWLAILKCHRDVAESIFRSMREIKVADVASLLKNIESNKVSPVSEELLGRFDYVRGEGRKLLIFLIELDIYEDDLDILFPKGV